MSYTKEGCKFFHLHVFKCKCFVLNNRKDNIGKFYTNDDEGLFLGYSASSKTFRIFNKRNLFIEELVHIIFDQTNPKSVEVELFMIVQTF